MDPALDRGIAYVYLPTPHLVTSRRTAIFSARLELNAPRAGTFARVYEPLPLRKFLAVSTGKNISLLVKIG